MVFKHHIEDGKADFFNACAFDDFFTCSAICDVKFVGRLVGRGFSDFDLGTADVETEAFESGHGVEELSEVVAKFNCDNGREWVAFIVNFYDRDWDGRSCGTVLGLC